MADTAVASPPRRNWTPSWELVARHYRMLPPAEVKVWGFKYKSGKIVDMQADYAPRQNPMDGQRPLGWAMVAGSVKNKNRLITMTHEQAKQAVSIAREKDWPVKKGVAAVIDRDEFSKNQLAALARSPDVYLTPLYVSVAANTVQDGKQAWTKESEDFFSGVAKEMKPATLAAANPADAKKV